METQDALDKLKKLQGLVTDIRQAAARYQEVARALSDPLGSRIKGYQAPVGYGMKAHITDEPRPLDELKELLFQIQSLHNDLELNADSIPDDNVKRVISQELNNLSRSGGSSVTL